MIGPSFQEHVAMLPVCPNALTELLALCTKVCARRWRQQWSGSLAALTARRSPKHQASLQQALTVHMMNDDSNSNVVCGVVR